VGFAVFLFVTAGTDKYALDAILNQGEYANKAQNNKAEKLIGTVAAVYWPVAVAVFLAWGFAGGWGYSWIVWPVAGVLFGAICGGIGAWSSSDRK